MAPTPDGGPALEGATCRPDDRFEGAGLVLPDDNWNGQDDKVPAMMQAYIAGAADVLAETAQAAG
jgi:hypothetical protein